jgi:hypothetical protein
VERLIKTKAEITLIPEQTSETLVSLLASGVDPRSVHSALSMPPPLAPGQ